MYTTCAITGTKVEEFIKASIPFIDPSTLCIDASICSSYFLMVAERFRMIE